MSLLKELNEIDEKKEEDFNKAFYYYIQQIRIQILRAFKCNQKSLLWTLPPFYDHHFYDHNKMLKYLAKHYCSEEGLNVSINKKERTLFFTKPLKDKKSEIKIVFPVKKMEQKKYNPPLLFSYQYKNQYYNKK
jgi:hypothetical protein